MYIYMAKYNILRYNIHKFKQELKPKLIKY